MARYSLSSSEHEIKRALNSIKLDIKRGLFVDIPMDFMHIFDKDFYIKMANTKKIDDGLMEINGHEVELKNIELESHEYDDGTMIYYIDGNTVKEALEKYSYTLAEDLRLVILSLLPQSVRELSASEYVADQYKFT